MPDHIYIGNGRSMCYASITNLRKVIDGLPITGNQRRALIQQGMIVDGAVPADVLVEFERRFPRP